tara:strand:+ start:317 stop:472 length:156 start_codon:yes stop_codon:yes gene_type:complete
MKKSKENGYPKEISPIEEYLQCISYCDIHPKGIDEDCEIICMERHLKENYF